MKFKIYGDDKDPSVTVTDYLTKREYFAVKMFQAIASNGIIDFDEHAEFCRPEMRAKQALILADALIQELNRTEV